MTPGSSPQACGDRLGQLAREIAQFGGVGGHTSGAFRGREAGRVLLRGRVAGLFRLGGWGQNRPAHIHDDIAPRRGDREDVDHDASRPRRLGRIGER